MQDDDATIFSI